MAKDTTMKQPIKWKEVDTGAIHAGGPDGNDYTLCGFSLDGDQGEVVEIERGRISCSQCVNTINYAKSIPARSLVTKS